MNRTVDDYDSMAKREMIKTKQEKAQMWVLKARSFANLLVLTHFVWANSRRVQKFRSDYAELRTQFEEFKKNTANEVCL